MQIQKPKREVDKAYKKYIERQPCLCQSSDCVGDIVCHHTVSVGAGGSDFLTVPLCGEHHVGGTGVHQMGKDTFQEFHNIDFQTEIINLLKNYIKGSL